MARVAKGTTALRSQAWLAAGGAFLVWLLAVAAALSVLLWGLWHHLGGGFGAAVLSLALFGVASVLMDRSLIPIRGYLSRFVH